MKMTNISITVLTLATCYSNFTFSLHDVSSLKISPLAEKAATWKTNLGDKLSYLKNYSLDLLPLWMADKNRREWYEWKKWGEMVSQVPQLNRYISELQTGIKKIKESERDKETLARLIASFDAQDKDVREILGGIIWIASNKEVKENYAGYTAQKGKVFTENLKTILTQDIIQDLIDKIASDIKTRMSVLIPILNFTSLPHHPNYGLFGIFEGVNGKKAVDLISSPIEGFSTAITTRLPINLKKASMPEFISNTYREYAHSMLTYNKVGFSAVETSTVLIDYSKKVAWFFQIGDTDALIVHNNDIIFTAAKNTYKLDKQITEILPQQVALPDHSFIILTPYDTPEEERDEWLAQAIKYIEDLPSIIPVQIIKKGEMIEAVIINIAALLHTYNKYENTYNKADKTKLIQWRNQ